MSYIADTEILKSFITTLVTCIDDSSYFDDLRLFLRYFQPVMFMDDIRNWPATTKDAENLKEISNHLNGYIHDIRSMRKEKYEINMMILINVTSKWIKDLDYSCSDMNRLLGILEDLIMKQRPAILHRACIQGHIEIVRILLNHGRDANVRAKYLWTPLHQACKHGHSNIVDLLLSSGANWHLKDKNGRTPLFVACQYGKNEIVATLLNRQADVTVKDIKGWTPIHAACMRGSLEVLMALLNANRTLITAIDGVRSTPLHTACRYGHFKIVRALVDRGADVHALNENRWTPLHIACWAGNWKVASFLIDKGANIHAQDGHLSTPLHAACKNGNSETSINSTLDTVMYLLNRGAKINNVNFSKLTPLHVACIYGNLEVAMVLIDNGADIYSKDKFGKTPIQQFKPEDI